MAGSFSTQLKSQQQQSPLTRTQRKLQQQKEAQAKYKFQALQNEAERLRTTEFVDKQVEYQEQEVSEYRPSKYSAQQWNSFSDRYKAQIMAQYSNMDRAVKYGLVVPHSYATVTKTKTDPFTFEEYQQEYGNLTPEIKQFFVTPESITAQNEKLKASARTQIDTRITTLNNRIENVKKEKEKYLDWYNRLSDKARKQEKARYKREMERYELELYGYQEEINNLNAGKEKVEQGYNVDDVMSYATNRTSEEVQRQQNINAFNQSLQSGQLDQDIVKLGLKKNVGYGEFSRAVSEFQGFKQYVNKVGFEKLPEWAKARANPEATAWQKENPNEVLQFDRQGNVIAIQSGIFGGKYSVQEYEKKIAQQQEEYKKQEEERVRMEKEATNLLKEKKFGEGVSFTPPKMNFFEKLYIGGKALYTASMFGGYSRELSESEQEKQMAERSKRSLSIFDTKTYTSMTPKKVLTNMLTTGGLPISFNQVGTISVKSALALELKQRGYDYKGDEAGKMLDELEIIKKDLSKEQIPYVEAEAFKILQQKGLETKQLGTNIFQVDDRDLSQDAKTTIISDPAFDRRVSQNLLELEMADSWAKNPTKVTKNVNYFNLQTMKFDDKQVTYSPELQQRFVGQTAVLVRAGGIKYIETYGITKGLTFAIPKVVQGGAWLIKGGKSLYSDLGGGLAIQSAYKTSTFEGKAIATISTEQSWLSKVIPKTYSVQMAEGTARVPIPYGRMALGGLGMGLTAFYGYSKYKQYGYMKNASPQGEKLFWAETVGELGGIEAGTGWGKKTFDKYYSRFENRKLLNQKIADISNQGFWRENKRLGFNERVYMERYQGFKLSSPKTWLQKVQGYKVGQFTGRAYKRIPDEVYAYYKYGGDVTLYPKGTKFKLFSGEPYKKAKVWRNPSTWELQKRLKFGENVFNSRGRTIVRSRNVNTGRFNEFEQVLGWKKVKVIPSRIIKAEPFPFDDPAKHMEWFMKKNYQYYGGGSYSKLPINVKGKAMGYSATGKAWEYNMDKIITIGGKKFGVASYEPDKILYPTKKGIGEIKLKGAYRYYSGKGVSAGFLRIFGKGTEESAVEGLKATKPTIYQGYFDEVQLNKAIREVRGTSRGMETKGYIYGKDTGKAGTLNIPLYKKEVEGTVEMAEVIPIRKAFKMRIEGWDVPIVEETFSSGLTPKELTNIQKSMGSIIKKQGFGVSSLPSREVKQGMFAIVKTPETMTDVSRVISKIEGRSLISETPSRISKISSLSGLSSKAISSSTSKTSKMSSNFSKSSSISELMSKISRISRSSTTSSKSSTTSKLSEVMSKISRISRASSMTSTTYYPRQTRLPFLISKVRAKAKPIVRQRKTPEIMGLFPDFTARAVGIAPKEVSGVEGAMREINKIQTGFEVRTGARIKGMDERKLMRSVMG